MLPRMREKRKRARCASLCSKKMLDEWSSGWYHLLPPADSRRRPPFFFQRNRRARCFAHCAQSRLLPFFATVGLLQPSGLSVLVRPNISISEFEQTRFRTRRRIAYLITKSIVFATRRDATTDIRKQLLAESQRSRRIPRFFIVPLSFFYRTRRNNRFQEGSTRELVERM